MASHLRPRIAFRSLDGLDVCGGCAVSSWLGKPFSLRGGGGRSTVVCLGFSWLWFLLGSVGTGARGLQWLLGVGSALAVARIYSTDSIREAYGLRGLLCSMWDLPGPGMKPVFPAWARDCLLRSHQGSPSPKLQTDISTSPLCMGEFLNDQARKRDTTCPSFPWDILEAGRSRADANQGGRRGGAFSEGDDLTRSPPSCSHGSPP